YTDMGDTLDFSADTQYVDCGNDASLNPPTALTVTCGFVQRSLPGATGRIMSKTPASSIDGSYMLEISPSNYLRFRVTTSVGTAFSPSIPIAFGTKYHAVATYDGAIIELYLNGSRVASGTAHTGAMANNGESLILGRLRAGATTDPLDGQIVDAQVYDEAKAATWAAAESAKFHAAIAANALNETQGWNGPEGYGAELVTNGTFDTDLSGWTDISAGAAGFLWSAGQAVGTSSPTDEAEQYQDITTVSGKTYQVSGLFGATWGGGQIVYAGTTASPYDNTIASTSGSWSEPFSGTFVATATTTRLTLLTSAAALATVGAFDDISCKQFEAEIPGGSWSDIYVTGE
ncbi:MAG: LamG domain-containing protein, partial [Deltaproteobacteria bacterium]|nr:LamG domain-containing protein [Deltaproteobacteria bacterium]